MTDQTAERQLISDPIPLDAPIARGDTTIDSLQLRRPKSGELRGLTMQALGEGDVGALIKLLPRIAMPTITEAEAANLDPADLTELTIVITGFLLQKRRTAG
jgi:hypothetical protein